MAIVKVTNNRYTVDSLYQWDVNQVLQIYGLSLASAPEIHFTNSAMADRAIVRRSTMDSAGIISVEIPNSILQKPYNITAYICVVEGSTVRSIHTVTIPVKARSQPNDYTITDSDNEVYSFLELERQITALEGSFAKLQADVNTTLTKANTALNNAETLESILTNAINTNADDIDTLTEMVGNLNNLETEDKTDIVTAINEVKNGLPSAEEITPVKGVDYWTEEDKAEMVDYVIANMSNASGVGF